MKIKKATLHDILAIAELNFDGFKDYELFNISVSEAKHTKALYEILKLNAVASIQKGYGYLCYDADKLIGYFSLIPAGQELDGLAFLKAGAWKIPLLTSFKTSRQLLSQVLKAEAILKPFPKDYWYLDTLVVVPGNQGSGYGSRILQAAKDLVIKNHGRKLRLITNATRNRDFYTKNAFINDAIILPTDNNSNFTTWSFYFDVK
ncbi:GNAT family N-acetyltransferase [Periweissella fabalis]|uniref:GNAT family N-acetyltransferase n=1 Tax=Periweissella fabalis TaxID=1070421 RepID=A0A7X6N1F0_9LACO|nr:GNAT family N-acetyltransferase [Periweissella fabalis]MCM0599030.1 GNAT family N-acetyltransferase [Periweissella fabalis]NKZ23310.1 GNAT family N-acetyltransferase [Periweissella fabalis]